MITQEYDGADGVNQSTRARRQCCLCHAAMIYSVELESIYNVLYVCSTLRCFTSRHVIRVRLFIVMFLVSPAVIAGNDARRRWFLFQAHVHVIGLSKGRENNVTYCASQGKQSSPHDFDRAKLFRDQTIYFHILIYLGTCLYFWKHLSHHGHGLSPRPCLFFLPIFVADSGSPAPVQGHAHSHRGRSPALQGWILPPKTVSFLFYLSIFFTFCLFVFLLVFSRRLRVAGCTPPICWSPYGEISSPLDLALVFLGGGKASASLQRRV